MLSFSIDASSSSDDAEEESEDGEDEDGEEADMLIPVSEQGNKSNYNRTNGVAVCVATDS